jgi:hypothetical protein
MGAELFHADRRTGMTKLILFATFACAPKEIMVKLSLGSRRLRFTALKKRLVKVVRLSAPHSDCLYPQWEIPVTYFLLDVGSTLEPQCGRKDQSMKNLKDPIRNRTRCLAACSAVPQLSATYGSIAVKLPDRKLHRLQS